MSQQTNYKLIKATQIAVSVRIVTIYYSETKEYVVGQQTREKIDALFSTDKPEAADAKHDELTVNYGVKPIAQTDQKPVSAPGSPHSRYVCLYPRPPVPNNLNKTVAK